MQKPVSASKESWSPDYLVQWSGYAVIKKVNKRVTVIHYKSPVMRKCSTANRGVNKIYTATVKKTNVGMLPIHFILE